MKKSLILLAAAAAIFASCNKQELEIPQDENKPAGDFSLIAETSTLSKTTLDVENYILWSAGDKLSTWIAGDAGNSNVALTLAAESAGQRVGKFSGSLNPTSESFTLYALYPYSESYGADPTSISLSIPTSVSASTTASGVVGQSDFMFASATLSKSSEQHTIGFNHPLSLVNITINGSGSIYREATIESVEMKANVKFVGDAVCNLSTGSLTLDETDPEAGKSLTINFPASASMSAPQNAWVAIAPVDLSAADCQFVITMTNGQKLTVNASPKKAFEAQTYYSITIDNLDTWISKGKASPAYYDLVAHDGGRANCYIITHGGYYRFDAKYPTNAKTLTITGTTKADWLWATGSESKVSDVSYFADNTNIYFKVAPGSNGNTIIAAFDESDNITWSWHIWMCTDDPRTPVHFTRNNAWNLIDRNLGATSTASGDVASYGFYYQWGRKDPFPGSANLGQLSNAGQVETDIFSDQTQSIVFNPAIEGAAFKNVRNIDATPGDLVYATANPTTFLYYNATGSNGLARTWLSTTESADAQALWNSTTDRKQKTNYDPCPAGYCVPADVAYAWHGNQWTEANTPFESNTSISGIDYSSVEGGSSYYPAAGMRRNGRVYNSGHTGFYWTAATSISSGNFQGKTLQFSNRATRATNLTSRTEFALSVRCMKQ